MSFGKTGLYKSPLQSGYASPFVKPSLYSQMSPSKSPSCLPCALKNKSNSPLPTLQKHSISPKKFEGVMYGGPFSKRREHSNLNLDLSDKFFSPGMNSVVAKQSPLYISSNSNTECTRDSIQSIYRNHSESFFGKAKNPLANTLNENDYGKKVSAWTFNNAKLLFVTLVKEFGEPTTIISTNGGSATWTNKAFYDSIVLKDVDQNGLQVTVGKMKLPKEGIVEIGQLSSSLTYNQSTYQLTSTENNMAGNVANLIVAIDMALDDDLSVSEAIKALPALKKDLASNVVSYLDVANALEENVREAHESFGL